MYGVSDKTEPATAYNMLYWAAFIFALGNGTLEAVANPLVSTLFPHNRTHYLNLLHASWPAGLMIGGACNALIPKEVSWQVKMVLFLIPAVAYGLMFLGQKMPKSEASEKGLSFGEMMKDVGILGALVIGVMLALFFNTVLGGLLGANAGYAALAIGAAAVVAIAVVTGFSIGSFLLFVLFVTHALIGAVELGTDNWAQPYHTVVLSKEVANWLFVFTSFVMFALRFCADFIEKKMGFTPPSLLLTCAVLACGGLYLMSQATSLALMGGAVFVYAIGKTFFWPTMLAVAGDRFPRTGAIAMSIMGGIGMMSAGTLGAPGLGYMIDRFSAESLKSTSASVYESVKAQEGQGDFLKFMLPQVAGFDGKKIGDIEKKAADARTTEDKQVLAAREAGYRKMVQTDAYIPATMAVIYLLLVIYFMSIGGYKVVHIDGKTGDGH
jgi:MFS family permease